MGTCARCGGEVLPGDGFCRTCGATAPGSGEAGGLRVEATAPLVEDAVWPDGSPAMDPFEPLEGRARWAELLIGAAGLVALIAAVLGIQRAEAIDTFVATGELTDLQASDDRFAVLALPSAVVSIAAIVLFLVWFARAYRNLPALGIRRLRFTPGWAVGAWFVPFLNFVRPKSIANDIWKGSDPELPPGPTPAWRDRPIAPLVHWWWGIYLLSFVRFNFRIDDLTIDERDATYVRLDAFRSLFTVAAAVLAVRMIARVTERQRERAERAGAA